MATQIYPHWLGREERKTDRRTVQLSGTVAGARIPDQCVEVCDMSSLGCRLRTPTPIVTGSFVTLASPSAPRLEGWVVWSRASECGVDFAHPIPEVIVEQLA